MLNIPDWADCDVLLSQYAFTSSSAMKFEAEMNDAFAAAKHRISVIPCRFGGSLGGVYFDVQPVTDSSRRFRGSLRPPSRWAVMYRSVITGDIIDVTDAWLKCFEKEFRVVSPRYSQGMAQIRASCNLRDGLVCAGGSTTTSANTPQMMSCSPTTKIMQRSLADPSNIEGCAGVNAKRDAILRKMFG